MPRFTGENIKFTEATAKSLRVPEGKKDKLWFDTEQHGFFIRKYAAKEGEESRATYGVKYTCKGQQRRLTLGPVLPGNLKSMRVRAGDIVADARRGIDVVADTRKARAAAKVKKLGELLTAYLEDREQGSKDKLWKKLRPKSLHEAKRYLRQSWEPFHKLAPNDVTREKVRERIEELKTANGPIAAKRAHAALSTFFAWLIHNNQRSGDNPTMGIKLAKEEARERVLAEPELVDVWLSAGHDDFGAIVKLLILTAQRLREIGNLAWPEIEFEKRQLELPAARAKNGKPHLVPLSPAALAILQGITRHDGGQRVFVGRLGKGMTSYSWGKARLDERIAAARGAPLPHFTLHDLRRSVVTHLSDSRVRRQKKGHLEEIETFCFAQPHVVEAIVNHISGAKAGIAGRYNKALYLAVRRAALEQWSAHLMSLVELRLSGHQSNARENSGEMVVSA